MTSVSPGADDARDLPGIDDAGSDGTVADRTVADGSESAPEPRTGRRRLFWWVLVIAALIVLLDQGSKWWAEAELGDGRTIPVIGDLIRFVLVYNPGAAFSIGADFTWIFAILAGIGAIAVAWFAWRVGSVGWTVALGLLLGGAITHLGDRLFREPGFGRGHVVDFIGYGNLFIGNVADIAIFAGAVMILVLTFMGITVKGGRAVDSADAADTTGSAESTKSADS